MSRPIPVQPPSAREGLVKMYGPHPARSCPQCSYAWKDVPANCLGRFCPKCLQRYWLEGGACEAVDQAEYTRRLEAADVEGRLINALRIA